MKVLHNDAEPISVSYKDMKIGQLAISKATGHHILRVDDGIISLEECELWSNENLQPHWTGYLLPIGSKVTIVSE